MINSPSIYCYGTSVREDEGRTPNSFWENCHNVDEHMFIANLFLNNFIKWVYPLNFFGSWMRNTGAWILDNWEIAILQCSQRITLPCRCCKYGGSVSSKNLLYKLSQSLCLYEWPIKGKWWTWRHANIMSIML
jgi:hypothetical protein